MLQCLCFLFRNGFDFKQSLIMLKITLRVQCLKINAQLTSNSISDSNFFHCCLAMENKSLMQVLQRTAMLALQALY